MGSDDSVKVGGSMKIGGSAKVGDLVKVGGSAKVGDLVKVGGGDKTAGRDAGRDGNRDGNGNRSGDGNRGGGRKRKEVNSRRGMNGGEGPVNGVGLRESQIPGLLKKYGPNRLASGRRVSAAGVLVSQFASPLIYILLLAAGVTGILLHDWVDAAIIAAAVIVNTILGFIQEYRAEKSMEALKSLMAPQAKVVRSGRWQTIPAADLVPGDLVILEIGSIVPADGVLTSAESLAVNEAILTGESVPVKKQAVSSENSEYSDSQISPENQKAGKPENPGLRLSELPTLRLSEFSEFSENSRVFMGTSVVTGIGQMIVTATGAATRMGQIAVSVTRTGETKTPLQRQVSRLASTLGGLVAAVAAAIFLIGLITGRAVAEMFELAVAIAVAAIPEGMAVSLTAILAVGMQRILKRKALVKKLMAAETLGSVTVICADKTGTLTEGKMRVVSSEFTDEGLGRTAVAVCNDRRDPLEVAMYDWVEDADRLTERYPRLASIPFSPDYKYIATLHEAKMLNDELRMKNAKGHSTLLFVSGAPEVLLQKSTLSEEARNKWLKKFEKYGNKGLRLVAFAYKRVQSSDIRVQSSDIAGLSWLGIVVFADPIRPGVGAALKRAQKLGLSIRVITGDYRATAEAVIKKLGVKNIELHARVRPEEKLNIVKQLQAKGEVVAMTGDGVNDAPALKAADIGIVVSSAADVARETADMVLLDNNFDTITAAILEGRGMVRNFKKVIAYLLSDAFAEITLISVSLFLSMPLPITAAQILWINLISDGFPNLALTVDPTNPRELVHPNGKSPLLDRQIKLIVALISATTGLVTLAAFWWVFGGSGNLALARTLSFAILGTGSLFYVFSVRSLSRPVWRTGLRGNPWLIGAVIAGFGLQILAIQAPFFRRLFGTVSLGIWEWGVVVLAGMLMIGIIEGVKLGTLKIESRK